MISLAAKKYSPELVMESLEGMRDCMKSLEKWPGDNLSSSDTTVKVISIGKCEVYEPCCKMEGPL